MTQIKKIGIEYIGEIEVLFKEVFMNEPWNDDWSNAEQLHRYIMDLIGNSNSLTMGIFENDRIIGVAMGNIRHWYSGTQYYIDELFITRDEQGKGKGILFLNSIEQLLCKEGIEGIFLQTERDMPAYTFYQKNGFEELKEHVSFGKRL